MSRSNTIISIISAALVVFLGVSAFVLSFDALQHMAVELGIDPARAWLYPAIIDGAVITFSLSVLRASLNHEKTRYAWVLVGIFTLISVILNIIHAQEQLLAQFLGAIPPIALFLSFELLMTQISSISTRMNTLQSLEELTESLDVKQKELDDLVQEKNEELDILSTEINQLTVQKQVLSDEIEQSRTPKEQPEPSGTGSIEHAREARTTKKEQAMNELLDYVSTHPNASLSDIAAEIGRSKSTAGTYVTELQEMNRLKKNEQGWEVVLS